MIFTFGQRWVTVAASLPPSHLRHGVIRNEKIDLILFKNGQGCLPRHAVAQLFRHRRRVQEYERIVIHHEHALAFAYGDVRNRGRNLW